MAIVSHGGRENGMYRFCPQEKRRTDERRQVTKAVSAKADMQNRGDRI
jgi:hypothetical protein